MDRPNRHAQAMGRARWRGVPHKERSAAGIKAALARWTAYRAAKVVPPSVPIPPPEPVMPAEEVKP